MMNIKRTSIVNNTKVIDVGLGSVFQIGDSVKITPRSWALAVQRQVQLFYGDEGDFAKFPIFTQQIPKLQDLDAVSINRYNTSSFIKVNQIHVTAFAAASVYHIGSTNCIDATTRIKHIRQLQKPAAEN